MMKDLPPDSGITLVEYKNRGRVMKTITVLLSLMTGLLCNHAASATSLSVGAPLELTFTNLPYLDYLAIQNQGGVGIELSPSDPLDFGDVVRLELFNDTGFKNPVSFGAVGTSIDFNSPTDSFGVAVINAFQNNQGGIRLTAISGSVTIESLWVGVRKDGNHYGEYLIASSVPEPESISLILVGLALIGAVASPCRAQSLLRRMCKV
jgi:hypothetical protein